jgi:hypothetical protein
MVERSSLESAGTTKHRVFVSFFHDDEAYRRRWDELFSGVLTSVSVKSGEIDSFGSAEYIKRLIREHDIAQASVVVVLVGPKTLCRKYVDWEVSAGLNRKVGGYSGLIGIWLPNHPNFGSGTSWTAESTPARLADNLSSGYAKGFDWTEDVNRVKGWVEQAFGARLEHADKINNGRPQFTKNLCD